MTKKKDDSAAPEHEASRKAILAAAVREFALLGEAGARMESIAQAAGVNKALLHYYFGTKERLYNTALDSVFQGMLERLMASLQHPGSAGAKILRFALAHFDYLAGNLVHPRLVGHEMMRARSGGSGQMQRLFATYLAPVRAEGRRLMREGMASGELRQVTPEQVFTSITGQNVFYFISAPINRMLSGNNPMERGALQQRREAILDFAAAALFTDRAAGLRLARDILQSTPLAIAEEHRLAPPESCPPVHKVRSPKTAGAAKRQRLI
jgi:TetR/AcrR family transcriptional regulator